MTRATENEPIEVVVGFESGVPVSLDGTGMPPLELITAMGTLAGSRGYGRLDMIENRRVGIKPRLRDWGVTESILPALADKAVQDGCHQLNPRSCDRDDLLALYRQAF